MGCVRTVLRALHCDCQILALTTTATRFPKLASPQIVRPFLLLCTMDRPELNNAAGVADITSNLAEMVSEGIQLR